MVPATNAAFSVLHATAKHLSEAPPKKTGRPPGKGIIVKVNPCARLLAVFVAALSLILAGLLTNPVVAGDDKGLGTPPSSDPSSGPSDFSAAAGDAWVNRQHSTANNERVDLRDDRIDSVRNLHGVNFDVLVRTVEWARSPRKSTSSAGIDRGIYQYKIYEYRVVNGDLQKTGRWCIIQTIIEWGDGHADRGWMVTTYPVVTNTGAPPQRNGKSFTPSWLTNSISFGPVNNDVLY